jgi:SM-20-related protein
VDAEDANGAGLLIEDLRAQGMAVRDGFLTSSAWRALAGCAAARRERGDFAAARVGAGRTLERREEIRGDLTCWLTPPLFDPEVRLLAMLEGLRLELNRGGIPGLFDLELHYAWYPPGAGYARHVDRPENRDARLISLVLYLNEDWPPGDGGALRCFDAVRPPRDIQPIGGRLVAFLSEGLEHAVLPAQRPRLSLTGWFRGREELPLRQ